MNRARVLGSERAQRPPKAVLSHGLQQMRLPAAERERYANATPLGTIGAPADVVTAIRYLISATYVTGETLFVDGGRHGAR